MLEAHIEFPENRLLIELCGEFDTHLAQIEKILGIQIARRGNLLHLVGDAGATQSAKSVLNALYQRLESGKPVSLAEVEAEIRMTTQNMPQPSENQPRLFGDDPVEIRTRKKTVEPRTIMQKAYVEQLFTNELVFGLGPAGTGKTYIAVAAAVSMFINGHVDRIILSRPAVEAGERLGFLPGDMKEKVDPYMQPLYDALHDFLPGKQLASLLEEKKIEIAPLAFMRGRTLANSFIVLDEAQNATAVQMKMFLTRLGENSRMAVTGDMSQIDLPRGTASGLSEAVHILEGVKGVGLIRFTASDVVRHPLVARIISAYDRHEKSRS